jgi:hypothetical protein
MIIVLSDGKTGFFELFPVQTSQCSPTEIGDLKLAIFRFIEYFPILTAESP